MLLYIVTKMLKKLTVSFLKVKLFLYAFAISSAKKCKKIKFNIGNL